MESIAYAIRMCVAYAWLQGHLDDCFSVDFSPDGRQVATASQDRFLLVHDLRKIATPLVVLKGQLGPIVSVAYAPSGALLAAAESDDYVNLYDVVSGFSRRQTIDFFGEVAGITFAPGTETLTIGVMHVDFTGLIEFVPSKPTSLDPFQEPY